MYRKAILNCRWTNLRGSPSNGPKTTSVNQQGGELVTLEEVTGLAQLNPDMPLVDRLARLGCSKTACDELEALLNAVDNLNEGSPLAPDIQRLLAECEAAERIEAGQRAAIWQCAA